jgi:hypothetical protein
MAAHEEIFLDRKTGEDASVGRAQRNADTEGGDGVPNPESDPVKSHTAAMRQQAGQPLDEGGLAASVRSDYRDARTLAYGQIDVVEQRNSAPIDAEPAENEAALSGS